MPKQIRLTTVNHKPTGMYQSISATKARRKDGLCKVPWILMNQALHFTKPVQLEMNIFLDWHNSVQAGKSVLPKWEFESLNVRFMI